MAERVGNLEGDDSVLNFDENIVEDEGQVSPLGADTPEALDKTLAKSETKAVNCLRVFVVLILFASAAVASPIVFLYTRGIEEDDFEDSYYTDAELIKDTVHLNAQQKLEAVGAIALQIQAHAFNQNLEWPFVTVPFFEDYVIATQSLTDAYGILFFPIVYKEQRQEWVNYSINNTAWINNSYAAQEHIFGYDGLTSVVGELQYPVDWFDVLWGFDNNTHNDNPDFSHGIAGEIFVTRHGEQNPEARHPGIDPSEGPYFPQWQVAPMGWYYQSTVNLNYAGFSDFKKQTMIVNDTKSTLFGEAWSDAFTPGYLSTLLYPIFDEFYSEENVVGFVSLDIFWKSFLEGILPPNDDSLHVVVDNRECGQVFTFGVTGKSVTFLDDGDLHETKFDRYKTSFKFGELLMEPISAPNYFGRPFYGDFCPYTFSIYPTSDMEADYLTPIPIVLCASVWIIFLFSLAVFLTYNWLVVRRQRLVMTIAKKADSLVSSLFPHKVKERLYQEGELSQNQEPESAPRPAFAESIRDKDMNLNNLDVNPLADLYPETTVMFADLVGFTKWSSTRCPSDVFRLLETIYGGFDQAAKRRGRGVFKVETIGDSYMACSGIPRAQEFHAVIMTRFASECILILQREVAELANSLGPDTADLTMRVGLSSGPVTGGVLRGERARFQLFGDTVNTASRMESTGEPNRIQVSESTALYLRRAGKTHWFKLRSNRVDIKGKGPTTTYWVNLKFTNGISSETNSINSMTDSQDTHFEKSTNAAFQENEDVFTEEH